MSHDPNSKDFDPYSAWLGIAPGTRPPTPEELVGVPPGEMDAARIINAGMARKKRLDGFALSEHRKLADTVNKEVADAVSLLLKRAESAPKPAEPIQAELAVEVVPGAPVETPVQPTMGVPVAAAPQPTVRVPVQSTPQAVAPAAPVATAAGQAAEEERRLREAAEAAGLVVLSPAGVEPPKERTDAGSFGILRFWGWLMLSPFRLIDAIFRAIAGEDNDVIHWFLRIMAVASLCVVCGVLLYHRSAEPPIVVVGGGGPSGSEEPAETDDDLLLEETIRELEMLDADQESRAAANDEAADELAGQPTSKSEWSGPTPPQAVAPFGPGDANAFQQHWAKHLKVPVEIENSIGMKLVLIPPGEFLMGSSSSDARAGASKRRSAAPGPTGSPVVDALAASVFGGSSNQPTQLPGDPKVDAPAATADEMPQHRVRINRPFYMAVRQVTRAEYQRVMPTAELGLNTRPDLGENAPIEFLSWDEAVAFCRCLSEQSDEKAEGRVYRLPREAEWEYACRAGTATRHYAGNDPASLAESASWTKANAWGLQGLLGNVQQWCADWYDGSYYAASPMDDPPGPSAGIHRVVRGGSRLPAGRRSAVRHHDVPKSPLFGFRVACETPSLIPNRMEPAKPATNESQSPQTMATDRLDSSQAKQLQARWARALKIPAETVNSVGMRLVLIPAGEFTMGTPDSEVTSRPDERPAHRVRITRPFYLGKCEVTQSQYNRILPTEWPGPGRYNPSDSDLPMVRVRWSRAVRFCERLSEQSVEKAAGRLYRLPTEAEWEYACRVGTGSGEAFGTRARLDDYAWHDGNSNGGAHPVGQLFPNPLGLHDMFGNVWEFCADWYADDYYQESPVDDPPGPETSTAKLKIRVLRGGAFMKIAGEPCSGLQPGHRGGIEVNMAKDFVGFRVAVTLASIPDETLAGLRESMSSVAEPSADTTGAPPGSAPDSGLPVVDIERDRVYYFGDWRLLRPSPGADVCLWYKDASVAAEIIGESNGWWHCRDPRGEFLVFSSGGVGSGSLSRRPWEQSVRTASSVTGGFREFELNGSRGVTRLSCDGRQMNIVLTDGGKISLSPGSRAIQFTTKQGASVQFPR